MKVSSIPVPPYSTTAASRAALLKTGKWVFGQQNEPVERLDWAINIASLSAAGPAGATASCWARPWPSVRSPAGPAPQSMTSLRRAMGWSCISGQHDGVLVAYRNSR